MLARDLAERYDEYAALLEDLERALAGEPIVRAPVPRAASSLDLAPGDPVTRELLPPSSSAPGGLLLGVVAVGLVALGVGWAARFAAGSGQGATRGTSGTREVDPSAASPAAAAEKTVAALEGLAPADLLAQPQTLAGLREQLAGLPAAERPALELRLAALTRRALQATEQAALARLEELYAEGEYARLVADAERTLAPYATFELAPPSRLSELVALARAATTGGAGEREREAWRAIAAAAGEPVRVVELGEGFAERFPFSPVAAEVARRMAAAEVQAPRVALTFEPSSATWSLDGGDPEREGPFTGRLRRGAYELRAAAAGYLPLAARLVVDGPLARTIRLGPRPERALIPDPDRGAPLWNPRRFVEDWARIGTWEAALAVAGMTGEAGQVPATAQRSLVELRRYLQGAPGWTFDWELVRPDGAPGVEGLAAEGRLFSEPGLAVVVGVAEGRVYLGLRRAERPDGQGLERLGDAPVAGDPLHLRLDWDGTLVVAHASGFVLGSFAPGWREPPATFELATPAGRAQFRDVKLLALKPAE